MTPKKHCLWPPYSELDLVLLLVLIFGLVLLVGLLLLRVGRLWLCRFRWLLLR